MPSFLTLKTLPVPLSAPLSGLTRSICFSPPHSNRDGEGLLFDDVYARSEEKSDPDKSLRVCIPCLDDLIALKKFDSPDPLKRERNLEDIRFLQTLKREREDSFSAGI
jgi:hypothetical protein